jgi:hypothetical protein
MAAAAAAAAAAAIAADADTGDQRLPAAWHLTIVL